MASRSAIGWVRLRRQAGIGSTRRRSTRRTSIRKDEDRAPITIDARSAVAAGAALEQDLLDLDPRGDVGRGRPVGGADAAQVDHALHAGGAGGLGEVRGGAAVAGGEVGVVGGLHRVHEVVGDVAALERLADARGR